MPPLGGFEAFDAPFSIHHQGLVMDQPIGGEDVFKCEAGLHTLMLSDYGFHE